MSASTAIVELINAARPLGLEVGAGVNADCSVTPAQYALHHGNKILFTGTAHECSMFLVGWGTLRSRVLSDLLVASPQALPEVSGQKPPRDSSLQNVAVQSPRVSHGARGSRGLVQGASERDYVRSLPRDQRQGMITAWVETAFGHEEATGLPQRGLRLLEEALEAFQACGGNEEIARELGARVFAHPPGMIGQELGGVAVAALALAAAVGLSADEEECREIHRVLSRPVGEFTRRNATKLKISDVRTTLPRNPCCGNVGSHGEGQREYCTTCGADLGARSFS